MNIKFNHEHDHLNEAINLSERDRIICRERIFFSTYNSHFNVIKLYGEDNVELAPRNLSTLTGDIEATIKDVKDDTQLFYTLYTFSHFHELPLNVIRMKRFLSKTDVSPEEKLKVDIIKMVQLMKSKRDDRDEEGDDGEAKKPINKLNEKNMGIRYKVAKECPNDFDKYLEKLFEIFNEDGGSDKSSDIDQMLDNILKKRRNEDD